MNDPKLATAGIAALEFAERRQRLRMAFFAVPLLLGILLLTAYIFQLDTFFWPKSRYDDQQRTPMLAIAGITMLATSGFGALMLYLQTGFRRTSNTTNTTLPIYVDAIRQLENGLNDFRSRHEKTISEYNRQNQSTLKAIQTLREEKIASLTDEERANVLALLKSKLESQAFSEVADGLKKEWRHDLDRNAQFELVAIQLKEAKDRLSAELEAVNRRGNLNLSIGIVTTLSGVAILGATVFEQYAGTVEYGAIILHYLPRVSLVLLIELFAFFFLKLYKASLLETKFFQNEITNIESRFTALLVALHRPQDFGAPAVIDALSKTERNFLLKQGETTVELEGMRIENDRQKGLIAELKSLLRKDDSK